LLSQKGSHQKWRHPNGRQVIVADHGNKPIPIGTLNLNAGIGIGTAKTPRRQEEKKGGLTAHKLFTHRVKVFGSPR
jgi:hypothetical protein